MDSYRGNKLWDYRLHETQRMAFATADGRPQDEIKRRAMTALRNFMEGESVSIAGPLWALCDVSHNSERVRVACQWFMVAAAYEDDGVREACCAEAYGWIERALRCYL